MKSKTIKLSTILIILILAQCNMGYSRVPDDYAIKEEQLTFENAMGALEIFHRVKDSFIKLIDKIDSKTEFRKARSGGEFIYKFTLEDMNEVGNTGWEIQNIGISSYYLVLHSYILLQKARMDELEYRVRKLEKASDSELSTLKEKAKKSRKDFEDYIGPRGWVD